MAGEALAFVPLGAVSDAGGILHGATSGEIIYLEER